MENITLETVKVYGLAELSGKVPELLIVQVENKNDPTKWNWQPHSPEKIINRKAILELENKAVDYTVLSNYTPSDDKQNVILIFVSGNLTYGMVEHCKSSGLKFYMIDYSRFALGGTVTLSNNGMGGKSILEFEGNRLDLDDVAAVIWNPPSYLTPIFDPNHIPPENGRNSFLFLKRWRQLLRDLHLLVPEDTIWLPGKPNKGSQEWQNKIGEYGLAHKLGFNIPPFICTNSKSELTTFIQNNNIEKILLREFSTPPFSFPPIHLSPDNGYVNLEYSPCFFQKYIEKKYELRIIVLFDQVFPCKIHSQDSVLTKNDWRVHDDANVKWEITTIPKELESRLVQLCKKLELNWASVDMIYSNDGNYYFLEANRPGAHYWLDAFVGLDISREIMQKLKKILNA